MPRCSPYSTQALALLLLASCEGGGSKAVPPGSPPSASWIRRPPDELRSQEGQEPLPPSRFEWVPEEAVDRAASILAQRGSHELSDESAPDFGAPDPQATDRESGRWYLLRGCEILEGTSAGPSEDSLGVVVGDRFVFVNTFGRRSWPGPGSRNRAVVAWLEEPPSEVYTDVQVAFTGGLP